MDKQSGVAIISGASGFVGQAIAKRLRGDGFTIAFLYYGAPSAEAAKMLSSLGNGKHGAFFCDFTQSETIASLVETIESECGRIAVCVHAAAAPLVRKKISDVDQKEFEKEFAVQVFGGFALFRAVARRMREYQHGTMIAITSAAIEPNVASGAMGGYIPAKYALRGMLREFARELAPYHITVHAVAPGFLAGGLNADLPKHVLDFMNTRNPMGNAVTPDDVAEVVSFLCSDRARFITGLSFPVAGAGVATL